MWPRKNVENLVTLSHSWISLQKLSLTILVNCIETPEVYDYLQSLHNYLYQDPAPGAVPGGELEQGAQGPHRHQDPADQGQPHHLHLPRHAQLSPLHTTLHMYQSWAQLLLTIVQSVLCWCVCMPLVDQWLFSFNSKFQHNGPKFKGTVTSDFFGLYEKDRGFSVASTILHWQL